MKEFIIETNNIDWNKILQHWSWLFNEEISFNIWILTQFADLFIHMDDNSIMRLDIGAGTLSEVAKNKEHFSDLLESDENFNFWFMPGLIQQLEAEGKILNQSQCYGFKTPTGFQEGSYSISNIDIYDIEEYFVTMGDLWNRLQNVKDGTKVTYK